MKLEVYAEAKKLWEEISLDGAVENLRASVELQKKLLDEFSLGPYYYYIFDLKSAQFRYVSPGILEVLGYEPEQMTLPLFLERIHPEDQVVLLNHENEVIKFFQSLPPEKLLKYKFCYDYRIKKASGVYTRIFQQVLTVEFNTEQNIHLTMGIHTDISHIKKENTSTLSFVGLDGEPSYYNVEVESRYKPVPNLFTAREKEILRLILGCESTNSIAEKLFISPHTVNTHRKKILTKAGVKTPLELALKVLSEGLL